MKSLKDLQTLPYEKKIRLLKIAALITALFILLLWGITLKTRDIETGDNSRLERFWNGLKEIRSKLNGQEEKI